MLSPREGVKAKTAEKVPGEFTYHFGLWSRIFGIKIFNQTQRFMRKISPLCPLFQSL